MSLRPSFELEVWWLFEFLVFLFGGIESIEIAFFQQANFMGILKNIVLGGNQKRLVVSSVLFHFSTLSLSLSSSVGFYTQ